MQILLENYWTMEVNVYVWLEAHSGEKHCLIIAVFRIIQVLNYVGSTVLDLDSIITRYTILLYRFENIAIINTRIKVQW